MRGAQGKMHRYTLKELRCIFLSFYWHILGTSQFHLILELPPRKPKEKLNTLFTVCRYFKDKERMQNYYRHVKINQALIFK